MNESHHDLQVDSARAESAGLRAEVEGLRRTADNSKEAEANRRDIENMRGEIVMLSKTFSDFVRRYRQVENGRSHMTSRTER